MYIVTKVFDDKSAELYDLGYCKAKILSESELINFSKNNSALGLSVNNNKINYIHAYSCMQFVNEEDAIEYCREQGLSFHNNAFINGLWWVFIRDYKVYHVAYYVMHYTEIEQIYVANRGICGYIQGAKEMTKNEAYKVAGSMNKARAKKYNTASSNYWTVHHEIIY